jgi:hypothetical protein
VYVYIVHWDHVASNERVVNNELERMLNEAVLDYRYLPGVTRKTTERSC